MHSAGWPSMKYPIAIERGDDTEGFGIIFPDISGAHAAGDTMEEAIKNAVDVAHVQLEELWENGQPIPAPSAYEAFIDDPQYEGMEWSYLDIDTERYTEK